MPHLAPHLSLKTCEIISFMAVFYVSHTRCTVGWLVSHVSGQWWPHSVYCHCHCASALWSLIVSAAKPPQTGTSRYLWLYVCVCVCVCEREREREKEKSLPWNRYHMTKLPILSSSYPVACPKIVHKHLWVRVKSEAIKACKNLAHVSKGGWKNAGISDGDSC